jgi:hypothetical protein
MPTKAELELRDKAFRAEQERVARQILRFWGERGHNDVQVWVEGGEIKSDLLNGKPSGPWHPGTPD